MEDSYDTVQISSLTRAYTTDIHRKIKSDLWTYWITEHFILMDYPINIVTISLNCPFHSDGLSYTY